MWLKFIRHHHHHHERNDRLNAIDSESNVAAAAIQGEHFSVKCKYFLSLLFAQLSFRGVSHYNNKEIGSRSTSLYWQKWKLSSKK